MGRLDCNLLFLKENNIATKFDKIKQVTLPISVLCRYNNLIGTG
jgi:hypothetical protein